MIRAPWIVFTLALTLTACASTSTSPQGPTGTWHLAEFKLDADEPAHRPSGGDFTLTLGANDRAFGEVACNNWQGRYSLSAGELFIDKAASTRVRCIIEDQATARLEPLFLSRLQSGVRMATRGDVMEITFADGLRWTFQRH